MSHDKQMLLFAYEDLRREEDMIMHEMAQREANAKRKGRR
jgi:hypothetical protein